VCTASWVSDAGALRLLFNRDELRTREPALPPALGDLGSTRWIAPRDGRAGGTWIAASDRGVALALLNRSEGIPPAIAASRGLLIPELLPAAGPEELRARLGGRDLSAFPPFRLLGLWQGATRGLVAGWDGRRLDLEEVDARQGLLCSSSLGDGQVTASRSAVWRARHEHAPRWSRAEHADFHRDHTPEPSADSVCMHREDACSVSLTALELAPGEVRLAYQDAPPCQAGAVHELRLPLRAPASAGG
jgi:hypothetical protein